ncbi:MAG: IS91 family transposase, partial [Ferruginibacter sp.]|nr:IS91 family transposase [Ferruginibacter sp.]
MAAIKKATTVQSIISNTAFTHCNAHTKNVFSQLQKCRTSALGYHLYKCKDEPCGQVKYVYHSCRNRHCPRCGGMQQAQWIDDRRAELLPINYYHVVFTLPHQLNSIILGNRTPLYKLLFDASAKTLLQFAADKKYLSATPGIISVLHTWGQQLSFHPHIHCIVTGGGITYNKNNKTTVWKNGTRNAAGFLFPVKAMAQLYKAIFIKGVRALINADKITLIDKNATLQLLQNLYSKEWVVYAKEPFAGPLQVVEYLSRYTHKIAINNNRILSGDDGTVTFKYKDYADKNMPKTMTISKQEFLRRFEQHILPKHFCKIRTTGYLANRGRTERLKMICALMQIPPHPAKIRTPWQVRL